MLGASAASRLLQRPTSPWAGFAVGAWLPLVDPRVVLDLGYQLSVAGIAALIASGALARRVVAPRLSGWRRTVARDLLASCVASAVTLPLIAWTFGRVSLIAPVANLAAAPLFALLQPVLFLALLLAPAGAASAFVADVAHLLLAAVDGVARVASAIPHASIGVAPTLVEACLLAACATAVIVACTSRYPARPAIAAMLALASALWLGPRPLGGGAMELHMLDVGQGDAIALRTPRGRWLLVDAGRSWTSGDAGRSTIVPYVRRRGGDVAAFILSHPHLDHVGGASTIMRALRPAEFWDGAYVTGSDIYRLALASARAAGVRWRRVHPGDSLEVDGVHVTYLAPDSAWARTLDDPNEASTVALVRFGRVRFLLVGDAERLEESWLLANAGAGLQADVLKVGHHGSSTSSTDAFLDAVRPSVALISVGAMNSYGHPSPAVVGALAERGVVVLRTDHAGTIVVRTDGRRLEMLNEDGRWDSPRARSSR